MVSSILALLTSVTAQPAELQPIPSGLPQLFVSACLDGQARLSRGDARAVGFDELPSALRARLGRPVSASVWQLNGSDRAYLYVLNYEPRPGVYPKICGLASEAMDLDAAANAVEARIAGDIYPDRLRGTQWLRPQDGYDAIATQAADFKVVQVNWLSEADRKAAVDELRGLSR